MKTTRYLTPFESSCLESLNLRIKKQCTKFTSSNKCSALFLQRNLYVDKYTKKISYNYHIYLKSYLQAEPCLVHICNYMSEVTIFLLHNNQFNNLCSFLTDEP